MHGSWLSPPSVHARHEGLRPSLSQLADMVDPTDPAFLHIAAVLREMREVGQELNPDTVRQGIESGRQRYAAANAAPAITRKPPRVDGAIVYYGRRGTVVKIGTTTQPRIRFRDLLPDEIMAFEHGGRELEAQRHREFADWRLGGSEYFEISEALAEHMRLVRGAYGDPHPSWPTLPTVSRHFPVRLAHSHTATSVQLVTADEAERRFSLGRGRINVWMQRGKLRSHGSDDCGRRLFLLDDVAFLVNRAA